ncbi:MAG: hypothetical protein EBQ89_04950 [Alphaproteobacteria bacterium]|nr:hypothetical protein [Alphaproteobacteria bacterium]
MTEPTEKPTPPLSAAPKKSGVVGVLAFVLAVVALAQPWVVVHFFPAWLPEAAQITAKQTAPDQAEGIAPDTATLENMQRQLESLNNRVAIAAGAIDNSQLASLAGQVAALEEKLAGGTGADVTKTQENLLILEQELNALKESQVKYEREEIERQRVQLLSYLDLRQVASTSRPFEREWKSFCQSVSDRQDVEQLCQQMKEHAQAGVATREALGQRFNVLAGATLQKLRLAEAPQWWDRVLAELQGVISVRRMQLDGQSGGPERVLFEIDAHLQRGELAEAIAAVQALPGDAGEPLQEWLRDAEARDQLETTLRDISRALQGEPQEALQGETGEAAGAFSMPEKMEGAATKGTENLSPPAAVMEP